MTGSRPGPGGPLRARSDQRRHRADRPRGLIQRSAWAFVATGDSGPAAPATVRLAAVLASLALPVRCPDALEACGATALGEVADVAAEAGIAAAQSSATPAARPLATAARASRDLRPVGAGWSSWYLLSDVMTTPLISLRVMSCLQFTGAM